MAIDEMIQRPEDGTGVEPWEHHPGYVGDISKFRVRRKRGTGDKRGDKVAWLLRQMNAR